MTTTFPSKPDSFRLPGYPVLVGPFTHLVEERDRLSALRWNHFEARRLGATIGAEISGLDLTAELSDEVIDELRHALHDYKVIFFRDQPMSPSQHVALARRFGELEIHPFLLSNTGEPELVRFEKTAELTGYENSWHHDVTWRECPSMGAVLHALSVPEHGGDTLFSDMYAAYDSLDGETKLAIDDLVAVHDFIQTFGAGMSREQRQKAQLQYPPVRHPVVCTHPSTGKRHLYVNRPFVSHIDGHGPRREQSSDRPALSAGRRPRAPVPLHMDGGRSGILGQPGSAALCLQRLLAPRPDHGACLHRRGAAAARARLKPSENWLPARESVVGGRTARVPRLYAVICGHPPTAALPSPKRRSDLSSHSISILGAVGQLDEKVVLLSGGLGYRSRNRRPIVPRGSACRHRGC